MESEDRQVLSIASQRDEIERRFAPDSSIQIVEVIEESCSARAPGRPIFDLMLQRIERGEADGIVSWHPDRLARNSVDGGRLIYLLDQGVLRDLKFANFSFENNSQGKFMLQIIFGYSKYYVDNLSENIRRGNRAKVERGWTPGSLPLGYVTDPATRFTLKDGEHFEVVRRIFNLVLAGMTVRTIVKIANDDWGYRMPNRKRFHGRPLALSSVYKMLGNPFYMGRFLWNGELHPGKHEPVVTAEQFQRVQEIIGRPGTQKPQRYSFPLTGLIRCGACGLMVTAENKMNRYGSRYVYYHCTKRRRDTRCAQPAVSGDDLLEQMIEFIERITLTDAEAQALTALVVLEREKTRSKSSPDAAEAARRHIQTIADQLDTLTDLRVRGLLTDDDFLRRRRDIDIARAAAEERLHAAERAPDWFEPALMLIAFGKQAISWFRMSSDETRRSIADCVGSNYTLLDKKLRGQAKKPFCLRAEEPLVLYGWTYVDDIRTRFELSDPDLLTLLDRVRYVKARVEEGACNLALPVPVRDEQEAKRDSSVPEAEPQLLLE